MTSPRTTVDVIVITFCRPDFVRENLEHLSRQSYPAQQVFIVDGSPDLRTERLVADYPFATYLRNPAGEGNMTSSRNEPLPFVTADVVAYLDDDAYAEPDYLLELARFYDAHPEVDLGCSRTLNGVPDEERIGVGQIGASLPNGVMLGYFGADPGGDIPVDHGLGATMHMRTSLIRELKGFREYYTGFRGCREDSDLYLRATLLGRQAWFVHKAVVLHVAAPQAEGQRFDLRYRMWSARNTVILLTANRGLLSAYTVRALITQVLLTVRSPVSPTRRLARFVVTVIGTARGVVAALHIVRGLGPQGPVGGFRAHGRPLKLPPMNGSSHGPSGPDLTM